MRNVTLRQLRAIATIAKTGKVLNAAEVLGVTPPAVTLQLRQLEDTLGMPLFDRTRDGMRPTTAGRYLIDTSHRIEAELMSCEEALRAMQGLKAGPVSIGVVSTAKYFAPAMLGAFKSEHPDVEIQLHVCNREETIHRLAELEFDLVIMGRPPEGVDMHSSKIGDHPHVIIAPPDHPLASQQGISVAKLANETFLTRESGSGTRILMEHFLADGGVKPLMGMEISSNETIKQAVMAGLGIAFISAHTVVAEIETGRLVILDVEGLPIMRIWRIAHHTHKRLMPAAAALWEFLVREGHTFLPNPMHAEQIAEDRKKGKKTSGSKR
ncbi:MAG: LysR family transcriptional regulator [Alphaproteobacteria bacterium]